MTPTNTINNFNDLTSKLSGIGNVIIYLLMAVGLIFIIWNIVMYFINASSDESRKEAGMRILWGIVGMFVVLSIWGLVNILLGTFVTNNNAPRDRLPNADFINGNSSGNSGGGSVGSVPSAANNFNTIDGSNSNTQNYNH